MKLIPADLIKKGLLLLVFVQLIFVWSINKSTFDTGDSIMHYLFAHYAFEHPENYLDHWAKPLFTLLSSPFAYFGWEGMRIFNLLVNLFTAIVTILICRKLEINVLLTSVIFLSAPYTLLVTSSGLTEPLFALFLVIAFYLQIRKQPNFSAFVVSLLPFLRSEGQIILICWLIYAVYFKEFKSVFFLFSGFIIYAIVGYFFVYHDLLWYFHQNPYNVDKFKYGQGNWGHFLMNLIEVIGVFAYVIIFPAIIGIIYFSLKNLKTLFFIKNREILLLFSCLSSFILFHEYAWATGSFGSFGLLRVLVCVLPILCIAISIGIKNIPLKFLDKSKDSLLILVSFLLIITPWINTKYSIRKEKHLQNDPSDIALFNACAKFKSNYTDKLYYESPLIAYAFDKDPFNKSKNIGLYWYNAATTGDLIVWDNGFGKNQAMVKLEDIQKDASQFKCIYLDPENRFAFFKKE
jgi:hypothetical protein